MVTIYLLAHTCDTTNNVQKVNYTHDNVKLSQLDLIAPSTDLLHSSRILTQDVNIVRLIFVPCKTLKPPPPPQPLFVIRAMLRIKTDYVSNQPYPFYLCNKKVIFSVK